MSTKSVLETTKKYNGLASNVKENAHPEEPKITQEQVISAFESFGFAPNERNNNDIGYWTTRPMSEGPKLMEELRKRRMEENKKEDDSLNEQNSKEKAMLDSKSTLPRLSDEDLLALFDEYGLPEPDPEWARSHLPNDPAKIRKILEMQRRTADGILSKNSKNMVDSVQGVPKQAPMQQAGAPMRGQGGPGPMAKQGEMAMGDEPVTPFFVGDHALVRITSANNPNSGTLWLVDKKKKVLRPILSEAALENAFEDPEAAQRSIVTLSSKALAPGGPLEGFTPLNADKGMQEDGSMEDIEFTEGQIQNKYGKPSDENSENKALSMLDGVFGKLNQ